ncbi:HGxxPAAW family protein [Actinotalea subterranea]|uniref:HGxxPAAW family protein n=1 Tax=Actinotalea subterranea TaxID=2607497 RepID=UPI0011EE4DC4|nr:HGxxPAAW family protein [Actinotalea subterranea]
MGDMSADRPVEVTHLPVAPPPRNHGHTTAAWVTVTLVLVGAVTSSIAVVVALPWLFWAGLGVILVGLVAGRVLKMLGLGQPDHPGRSDRSRLPGTAGHQGTGHPAS